jgi:Lrp/AsnC family leucine-responsive transcriptional regulator
MSLDDIDRRLLQLLQRNGKLSYAELGSQVGLSISAVNERLKKLQEAGVIQGFMAVVNPRAVDLDVCAFMQVLTGDPVSERAFLERLLEIPEIQECHHITGEFSYMLKIRARSTADFEALLQEKIKTLPGVVRTLSTIVLSSPKETAVLPIASAEPPRRVAA